MKHPPLDAVAAAYVPLILAIQRHSETYVDFYFGPEEWRARAKRVPRVPVESLLTQTRDLLARTRAAAPSMRRRALERQLIAVDAYLRILGGAHIPWREEARLLFDADPGVFAAQQYRASLARLRSLLPGRGTLSSRLRAYLGRFSIPPDRLRAVIGASLEATRERTVRLIDLPRGERLTISFVRGKPWAA